ncbi:MAG: hypothetical protein U5M53_11430 [Rhodoferax sp.]|nr:hypothetical protein [Rhodoferax sp.]
MSGLSDYEDWLDELDRHLYATLEGIHCDYGGGLFFPYSSVRTFDAAMAIARDFSLMLLDEKNTNASYMAKRFLRLATAKATKKRDVDEEFKRHEFQPLSIESTSSILVSNSDSLLGMEFRGPGPNHFVRLSRTRDAKSARLYGPLQIERPAFGNWRLVQSLEVDQLDVVLTPTVIVLDLPIELHWLCEGEGKLTDWRQDDAMRIALHHGLDANQLQSVLSSIEAITTGLTLKVRHFKAMDQKHRSTALSR